MKKLLFIFTVISLYMISLTDVSAIPAFARKYSLSCQTCHTVFPKVKAYGDEVAGNGFVIPDKDTPRYYIETGDTELSLLRELPLALRIDLFGTYQNRKSMNNDFKTPYNLKIMSGGEFAKDISYYFYFFFSERGEVAGVEDAFIMFNNLFGTELDAYIGQFQVSDPLFKRELRLTIEDYAVYKAKPGVSVAGLTYDRGIMLTYGFDTGTDIIFEILNGNGLEEGNSYKNFDDDNYKNFMLRLSQDIGDYFRIGAFGYYGKEDLVLYRVEGINRIKSAGVDFTFNLDDKLEFNTQYVMRNDTRPLPNLYNTEDIKTKGVMSELIYMPNGDESKWYTVGLFNLVESDFSNLNYKSATLSFGYMLRRNLRVIGEYTYNLNQDYGILSTGIITAF